MHLTPRQMLILVVLVVGFGVAAYVVSRGETSAEFDRAGWCDRADVLAGSGPILTGTAADASIDDIEAVKLAIFDVETIGPVDLWGDFATLADFLLRAEQARADLDWPAAFLAARANNEAAIETAVAELEAELTQCGLAFG